MKGNLGILLLLFFFLSTNAQTSSWSKHDYISSYSRFLNRIDTVHLNGGDLEVRLWYNDGGNRWKSTVSFIALTRQNSTWEASYYTFAFLRGSDSITVNKITPVKLNYDSLYKQLLQDGLLTLNSDTITEVMDKNGQHRGMWLDGGPTNYTIQIVTAKKTQTTNFMCPKHFYMKVKIAEFELPYKVISSILKLIPFAEPC